MNPWRTILAVLISLWGRPRSGHGTKDRSRRMQRLCARNLCTVPAVAPSSTGSRCRERSRPAPTSSPQTEPTPAASDASQATDKCYCRSAEHDTPEPAQQKSHAAAMRIRSELIAPSWTPPGPRTHLLKAGRPGDAVVPLREAARWMPGNAAILHDLGLACLECGRIGEAVTALQSSVSSRSGLPGLASASRNCVRGGGRGECPTGRLYAAQS